MHTGDYLHDAAITQTETAAIGGFHLRRIRSPVTCQRYFGFALNHTGHAGRPEDFVVQIVVDKVLNIIQRLNGVFHRFKWRCNQLGERLGKISGYL